MYYLRKKGKCSKSSTYSYSTVNCNFSAIIHEIQKAYADLDGVACNASLEMTIVSYINDFRLLAAIPWYTIDNIFIPINVKDFTRSYWLYSSMIGPSQYTTLLDKQHTMHTQRMKSRSMPSLYQCTLQLHSFTKIGGWI